MTYVLIFSGLVVGLFLYALGMWNGRRLRLVDIENAKIQRENEAGIVHRTYEGKIYTLNMEIAQLKAKIPPALAAPDPSGARAAFFSLERPPLLEVTQATARQAILDGKRAFLHPFDPIEIHYFDKNGFQAWAMDGYRIEGVRYYVEYNRPKTANECGGFFATSNNPEICVNCGSHLGNHRL